MTAGTFFRSTNTDDLTDSTAAAQTQPTQLKKAPNKIKPKACLFFVPQEFNEEKCATCFFMKTDHSNVKEKEAAVAAVCTLFFL